MALSELVVSTSPNHYQHQQNLSGVVGTYPSMDHANGHPLDQRYRQRGKFKASDIRQPGIRRVECNTHLNRDLYL